MVHDALVMGPRQGPDTVTPHTRPPADDDAAHLLVRTVECLEGTVEVELVCEPAFDYGRVEATWTLADAEGHRADAADAAGPAFRLSTDMLIGIEGGAARARHVLTKGETRVLRAVVGGGPGRTRRRRGGRPRTSTRPSGSGATGWRAPGSPTTACGTRSSGPPSPSRASPTCRPARPWRR